MRDDYLHEGCLHKRLLAQTIACANDSYTREYYLSYKEMNIHQPPAFGSREDCLLGEDCLHRKITCMKEDRLHGDIACTGTLLARGHCLHRDIACTRKHCWHEGTWLVWSGRWLARTGRWLARTGRWVARTGPTKNTLSTSRLPSAGGNIVWHVGTKTEIYLPEPISI